MTANAVIIIAMNPNKSGGSFSAPILSRMLKMLILGLRMLSKNAQLKMPMCWKMG